MRLEQGVETFSIKGHRVHDFGFMAQTVCVTMAPFSLASQKQPQQYVNYDANKMYRWTLTFNNFLCHKIVFF